LVAIVRRPSHSCLEPNVLMQSDPARPSTSAYVL
jgi:hypothetical protein